MPHRETFYQHHDKETGTTTYGSHIYDDKGGYSTRYDRFSNFDNYDNYKGNHEHEFNNSSENSSGSHGKYYEK